MNPGIYGLTKNDGAADLAIAAAGTIICDVVDGLAGMSEADVQCRFVHGSGGTKVAVYIQASLDHGSTWIDLWCFTAATASKVRARRLKPDGNEVTPTDGALADDSVASGIVLGDRLRAKVVVTGTYAGSTVLAIRAAVR